MQKVTITIVSFFAICFYFCFFLFFMWVKLHKCFPELEIVCYFTRNIFRGIGQKQNLRDSFF